MELYAAEENIENNITSQWLSYFNPSLVVKREKNNSKWTLTGNVLSGLKWALISAELCYFLHYPPKNTYILKKWIISNLNTKAISRFKIFFLLALNHWFLWGETYTVQLPRPLFFLSIVHFDGRFEGLTKTGVGVRVNYSQPVNFHNPTKNVNWLG